MYPQTYAVLADVCQHKGQALCQVVIKLFVQPEHIQPGADNFSFWRTSTFWCFNMVVDLFRPFIMHRSSRSIPDGSWCCQRLLVPRVQSGYHACMLPRPTKRNVQKQDLQQSEVNVLPCSPSPSPSLSRSLS